jgi:hypothetical protein
MPGDVCPVHGPKPGEREATKQANDLLRRLKIEAFEDGIFFDKLPHAVGLVMDFAQASAAAALERAAQIAQTYWLKPHSEFGSKIADAIRALKGRE